MIERHKRHAKQIKIVCEQIAGADGFRYIVERRHLESAAEVIEMLQEDIFKLERYCRKSLDNAEDVAAGRADHIVKEIEEFLNA